MSAATIAPRPVEVAPPLTMPVEDAILGRRSVRSYTGRLVDRATLDRLLALAVRAPTAMHLEPWTFLVLQDPLTLKRLAKRAQTALVEEVKRLPAEQRRALEHFAREDYDPFHGAGTLVVVCERHGGRFASADCWLAAGNLMLAAHAMGLGTCVIGCAVDPLNAPEWKAKIGMPHDVTAVAPIVVGFPDVETPETSRKPPEVLVPA
jgi:nitroreductase